LRRPGGTGDTISGRRCPLCGSPLAGEHKPNCSHLHSSLIAHPKSPRGLVESAETCVEQVPRFSREPRKQRSKRALGRKAELHVSPSCTQTDINPRGWTFSFVFSPSRPCKWTRALISKSFGFKIWPALSKPPCFAAKRGLYGQDKYKGELSAYAIGPRGTRTGGTFGLRWCPLCRPACARPYNPQRRSLCFHCFPLLSELLKNFIPPERNSAVRRPLTY